MLGQKHPILQMVEKLKSFKKLNNELNDENKNLIIKNQILKIEKPYLWLFYTLLCVFTIF